VKFFNRLLFGVCGLIAIASANNAEAVDLFATTAAGATGELYKLNAATGAVLQDIGPLNDLSNVNYPITGLAFQRDRSIQRVPPLACGCGR